MRAHRLRNSSTSARPAGAVILATPLALGSYWALLPAVAIVPVLALRILDEEKLLLRDLPGYPAYTRRVRHRLFPAL